MTAKGELERLNRMGSDAANQARHENYWTSHAGDRDHTARHFALGMTALSHMPVVGRWAVSVFFFVVICLVLSLGFGVARPGGFALAAVIAGEAIFYMFKRRRLNRLHAQGKNLQSHLHDLKEQEFDVRYQQAKANSDLDRFKRTENS